jgi:hypothetical protein
MREKFKLSIRFCGNRTVSSPGTASLGWLADPAFGEGRRAGASFFTRHLDYFIVTRNFTAIYLDLVPSPSFTVTRGFAATYRDWQKTRHHDTDGT